MTSDPSRHSGRSTHPDLYELSWSAHGNVMVVEYSPRPAPLTVRGRQRVASAVTIALIAAAAAGVLYLIGQSWGLYLLVIPVLVFGLIAVWSQLRSVAAVNGQRTIGVSNEVVRVHALGEGGLHEVGAATRVEAEDDRIVVKTGSEELLMLDGLVEDDAEQVARALDAFLSTDA